MRKGTLWAAGLVLALCPASFEPASSSFGLVRFGAPLALAAASPSASGAASPSASGATSPSPAASPSPTPIEPDYDAIFGDRDACFALVDARTGRDVARYNPGRCAERLSPCSTFKVPLAVMAFDRRLINERSVFKWDGHMGAFPGWDADQTPRTWLLHSVVWVSQRITPRLGRPALTRYLRGFGFGNADASGDIRSFWLNARGTLQVSADEELAFWRRLRAGTLPASRRAQAAVVKILPRLTGQGGSILSGKTGTGYLPGPDGKPSEHLQLGWYVGLLHTKKKEYLVACNFSDRAADVTKGPGGPMARTLCTRILHELGLY